MPTRLRPAPLVLALSLLSVACGDDDAGTGFGVSGQTGITSATTATQTTDAQAGSSGDDPLTAGDASTTTAATTASTTSTTSTTGNPNGLPNGSECAMDSECLTGNCFTIPIPIGDFPMGICADCDEDIDCTNAGTGISCTLNAQVFNAVCTDGDVGSFCQSQAACQGDLFCDELVDGAMGLLPNTCSACRDDADCSAPNRCIATVDVVTYTGTKQCAAPGTVLIDHLCPLDNGDAMCSSGHCNPLDLAGLLMVGVCSECSSDADCGGLTCSATKFDSGFIGSKCM